MDLEYDGIECPPGEAMYGSELPPGDELPPGCGDFPGELVEAEQGDQGGPAKLLEGYLDQPIVDLVQKEALVYGAGAKRDSAGVLGMGLTKLNSEQAVMVKKAKKYAMEVSIKMVLMKQTLAHQQQQAKSSQRNQAIAMMSRIYVGCINYDTREDAIRQAFSAFGPIRSITMSWDSMTGKHKGFAFVEFEQPEAAQLALEQMNGILVCGRNIKVGLPSQIPQAQQFIDEIKREAKAFNRIYVASIHKDLSDDDIRSVFSAFGAIKSCDLAPAGVPGRHKGYGYLEYDTEKSAQEAISSMNLFDLGGQYLRVGRAITPPDSRGNMGMQNTQTVMPSAAAVAAAAVTAKIQAMESVASNLGVDASKLVPEKKETPPPARPRKRSRSRDKLSRSPARDARPSPAKQPVPVRQEEKVETLAAPAPAQPPPTPIQPPPTIPVQPHDNLSAAEIQKEKKLELEKKLMQGDTEPSTLKQQEDMSIKGKSARQMVMHRLMGARPAKLESSVLLLRNMVSPDEVDEDLQGEIEEECGKYGQVENLIIYQERQSEDEQAEIVVKIFVEYNTPDQVKKAKSVLDGRFFGGRTISAVVYDQELYDQQDLSG